VKDKKNIIVILFVAALAICSLAAFISKSVGIFSVIILTAIYLAISVVIASQRQVKPGKKNDEEKSIGRPESGHDEQKTHTWIWEVDATGKYTYCNAEVKTLLGYSPEELVGKKHFYDLFLLQERETLKVQAFEKFAEKRLFQNFVNANLHKNGQIVWLITSGKPLLDKEGNLRGYRGCDVLIAEHKKNLAPLRAVVGSSV